ncbi:c13.1 [Ichnoviriform fugitivi]|uniref:C13.1 n=1 Tax=Ichnoviriform fugitivi TaxID=265522 RepID=A2Q0H7_9VIRU|nr:c13.1 [Ichnoviriform fugitivi]BAF45692.1 c13.1 [Ichnoviriform fugitivi]
MEVLQGFENTEIDVVMLGRSPRVQLVPLSTSEVADLLPNPCESLSQRPLSSAPALEATDLALDPISRTGLDSSSAAPEAADSAMKPRHRVGRSLSCAATTVTPRASRSRTRTTRNSFEAAMSPKQLESKPRSQEKRASTAAREVTEPVSEPVRQTEQDSSFTAVEVTKPAQEPLLLTERRTSWAPVGDTYPASKLRYRSTGNSLDAALDAIERNKRDCKSTAPKATEPVTLEHLFPKQQNLQYGPVENTDSTPEPLPPKEQNPSPARTIREAATSAERSPSPNQEESSCAAPVNVAAALPEPTPPLASQNSTPAAQESRESKTSSVGENLQDEPCTSCPRMIKKVAKSREYVYNFRFCNDKVENYVCNACFIFQITQRWLESCELRGKILWLWLSNKHRAWRYSFSKVLSSVETLYRYCFNHLSLSLSLCYFRCLQKPCSKSRTTIKKGTRCSVLYY